MHAVVTGATGGIGEAIARRLAAEGLSVTLVGRSDVRLREARERIAAAVPGADLVVERADLAEPGEVRDLARSLLAGPRPDAVVHNAAVVAPLDHVTSGGLPRVLAVNYLAPYLLTRLLAPDLGGARVVVVNSDPGLLVPEPTDLDDLVLAHPDRLGDDPVLRPYHAYLRTKSMAAMFAAELARRAPATAVNSCHPGMIAGTGLGEEAPGLAEAIVRAYREGRLPAPSRAAPDPLPGPDVGADTACWLAASPGARALTGRFCVDRSPVEIAPHLTDPGRCAALWRGTAELVGLPG